MDPSVSGGGGWKHELGTGSLRGRAGGMCSRPSSWVLSWSSLCVCLCLDSLLLERHGSYWTLMTSFHLIIFVKRYPPTVTSQGPGGLDVRHRGGLTAAPPTTSRQFGQVLKELGPYLPFTLPGRRRPHHILVETCPPPCSPPLSGAPHWSLEGHTGSPGAFLAQRYVS